MGIVVLKLGICTQQKIENPVFHIRLIRTKAIPPSEDLLFAEI